MKVKFQLTKLSVLRVGVVFRLLYTFIGLLTVLFAIVIYIELLGATGRLINSTFAVMVAYSIIGFLSGWMVTEVPAWSDASNSNSSRSRSA